MSIELRSGGWWVKSIAGYGELTWSHTANGGCKEASWRMDLAPTFVHSALVPGAMVELRAGSSNVFWGKMTEPDQDDDWTFHALGLAELGRDYLCFDGPGRNSTSIPDVAIDQAIADGLPWRRTSSLSSVPFAAEEPDGINKLGDLLDAWATGEGKRWGVGADGVVYAEETPTEPTWHLAPGVGRLGLADDDYASNLYGRYLGAGGYATASVEDAASRRKFGYRAAEVDLTPLGLIDNARAEGFLNGMLALGKARQGFTNGVEVARSQLTYPGGGAAYLPFVKAGELVRMHGVLDEQAQVHPHVDWVIGETQYVAGADTITLTPAGLADRTLTDVLTVKAA